MEPKHWHLQLRVSASLWVLKHTLSNLSQTFPFLAEEGGEGIERHGLNVWRLVSIIVVWLALTRKTEAQQALYLKNFQWVTVIFTDFMLRYYLLTFKDGGDHFLLQYLHNSMGDFKAVRHFEQKHINLSNQCCLWLFYLPVSSFWYTWSRHW